MPTYEQNKKSAEKYLATQDRITIRVPKESGLKTDIEAHAAAQGESVQGFIIRAVKAALEAEKSE